MSDESVTGSSVGVIVNLCRKIGLYLITTLKLEIVIAYLCRKIGLYFTPIQSIKLSPFEVENLILDIGGGGEGIVGRLNGSRVVAVDINKRELAETRNAALKIVMDATDLNFLPGSFDVCTAFFSLMYIPKSEHSKVFEEANRVLKDNGQFLLWDVKIPKTEIKYKGFIVPLKVQLPNETVVTGYGAKMRTQDINHFRKVAEEHKFKIVDEWIKGEILHLKMTKES